MSQIRVLHVEDEPEYADLLANFLTDTDVDIHLDVTHDPEDGLERFLTDEYDCIISDYLMEPIDGINFLDHVREHDPDVPFILLTGHGNEAVASDAISSDVTDYVVKDAIPDRSDVLVKRITNVVSAYEQQNALEQTHDELQRTIQRVSDGFFAVDSNWRYTVVNDQGAAMLNRTREELLGKRLWDAFPELHGTDVETALHDAMETNTPKRIEQFYPPLDAWFAVRIYPDEEGISMYFEDITEHREREHELAAANALLSTLFETLPVGVNAEDADRNVRAINGRLLELFNVDGHPNDIVGMDVQNVATEAAEMVTDADDFVNRINELAQRRQPVRNEEIELTDGRTLMRSYEPIDLPDGEGHLWVYQDVTFEREYQHALEQLYEHSRDLMHTTTREETATVAVQAATDILGAPISGFHLLDEDESSLEPIAFIDTEGLFASPPVYERDSTDDPVDTFVWSVFQDGEPVKIASINDHTQLRGETPAESTCLYPLEDHGVFIISSSQSHAFQEAEYTLADILSQLLMSALTRVDRESTLRQRERELQRQNERLQEFTSVVSHDLRNPLTVAQGHLQLANEVVTNDHLNQVEDAHQRMLMLIEDLLAFAREGMKALDLSPIEISSVLDDCWKHVDTRDATLDNQVTGTIEADENRLRQLFENLFRNCVEHGGSDVTVTVGTLSNGIFIEDDGPGIAEGDREHVFETGYSTTEHGTGFGLRIVKEIVESHGWAIAITDARGGGARFEITGVQWMDD